MRIVKKLWPFVSGSASRGAIDEVSPLGRNTCLRGVPQHVAVVMDGNGRWAQRRQHARIIGHRSAVKRVKGLVSESYKYGVKTLSLFAFSTENWSRPELEVQSLMGLCQQAIGDELDSLHQRQVKIVFIGDKSLLPAKLQQQIVKAQQLTCHNKVMCLQICLNYGGRWDIVSAAKVLAKQVAAGEINAEQINESSLAYNLPGGAQDIDLFIRTSNETRVSNFMLWQLAYAEIYFTEVLFPDFDEKCYQKALAYFAGRSRRFGGVVSSTPDVVVDDVEHDKVEEV